MGVKLGDAIVFFHGDPSPLDAEQAASEKKTRSWTSRVGGLITGGIKVAAVGAAGAIAGIGGAAIKAAIDAMPLQGIKDAFAGISGEADKMMGALREGALGMVSDAQLMETYNQAASLVGKNFADQLPAAMGYLGKVAASTGQDMDFMMQSLTLGVGRMSPMILDNLNIQVTLAQATEKAAEMFGVQASELSKSQQQAGMMNVVLEKLAENTRNMPEITGTAMQGWKSLFTQLKNVKDQVGLALTPALGALIKPLGSLATKYGPMFTAWVEKIGPLLSEKVTQGIETLTERAGELWQRGHKVVEWFRRVWAWGRELATQFRADLLPVIQHFAGRVLDAFKRGWSATWMILQAVWGWIRSTGIPLLQQWMVRLRDEIIPAIRDFAVVVGTALWSRLQAVWGWIQAVGIPVLMDWYRRIKNEIIPAIWEFATTVAVGLWARLQTVWAWIQAVAIPRLLEFYAVLSTKAREAITTARGYIALFRERLAQVWDWIQAVAIPRLIEFYDTLRVKLRRAVLRARVYISLFRNKIAEVWDWIQTVAIPRLQEFYQVLSVKLRRVVLRARVYLSLFRNKIAEVWTWMQTTAIPWFEELWDKITSKIQDFKDGFATVSGEIMPTFREALEILRPAVDGLKDAFANLLEKFGATGEKAGGLNIDFRLLGQLLGIYVINTIKLATTAIYGIVRALTWFVDLIGRVKDGFVAWGGIFDNIKDALGLLGDKFRDFWDKLPDAIKPGSASPLELAFRGIATAADAAGDVTGGAGGGGPAPMLAGAPAAAMGGGNQVAIYGPIHVHGVQDGPGLIETLTAIGRA